MTNSMTSKIRTYSELIALPTLEERYEYCRLPGNVGEETFGFDRFINQQFYRTSRWEQIRQEIIVRDQCCELGLEGFDIPPVYKTSDGKTRGNVFIHHLNPIAVKDLVNDTEYLTNPEYLVCVSKRLHDAIHYGDKLPWGYVLETRSPGDTCPWTRRKDSEI